MDVGHKSAIIQRITNHWGGTMSTPEQFEASERQWRLFECACCRSIWHLLVDERSRHAVEAAERYADGMASDEELAAAREGAIAVHTGSAEVQRRVRRSGSGIGSQTLTTGPPIGPLCTGSTQCVSVRSGCCRRRFNFHQRRKRLGSRLGNRRGKREPTRRNPKKTSQGTRGTT